MQISFAVIAKLITAFVFTTRIGQSLYFLYTKFQASSHLVWLYSLICVEDRFSHNEAHLGNSADPPPIQVQGLNCWQLLCGLTFYLNYRVIPIHFLASDFQDFYGTVYIVILQVIIGHKVQKCHF